MSEFSEGYAKLNSGQKMAVDQIYGPLLVLAGPGTGKTQLLSVRVANILEKTDAQPEEILCLTFTESAAEEMRRRLETLIGQTAYRVTIETFHGFGSKIMGRYPEYFYGSLEAINLSDLDRARIIHEILEGLPHNNPLASKRNGQHVWAKAMGALMGEIKKGGLDSDYLQRLNEVNQQDIELIGPLLKGLFDHRISQSTLSQAQAVLNKLQTLKMPDDGLPRLIDTLRGELKRALQLDDNSGLSKIKKEWLEGRMDDLKVREIKANEYLLALADFFLKYQTQLDQLLRYDYDDMIMQVLSAMDREPDLLADLQEQSQYLLVDEFQDTNDAQLKLLLKIAEHSANEGQPNLMVVGDDDQAIFKFQGATLNNMQTFLRRWPKAPVITITDNYRSGQNLLDLARYVITQTEERVENDVKGISKQLKAVAHKPVIIRAVELADEPTQAHWLAEDIIRRAGERKGDWHSTAVIARRHKELEDIAEVLAAHKIPIIYKRKEDILSDRAILDLLLMAETVQQIAESRLDDSDNNLKRLLSHPMWGIEPLWLWQVSLEAYRQHRTWLEMMQESGHTELKTISQGLIAMSTMTENETMDTMLDVLIGNRPVVLSLEKKETFSSPYRSFHFSEKIDADKLTIAQLEIIQRIRTLRRFIRDLNLKQTPTLATLIDAVKQARLADMVIMDNSQISSGENAVELHTAHSVKGLEFSEVYIISAIEQRWNSSWSGGQPRLPKNITFIPAGDSLADKLRLFYVAITRARERLTFLAPETIDDQRPSTKLSFLVDSELAWEAGDDSLKLSPADESAVSGEWFQPHLEILKRRPAIDNLKEQLKTWRLSASALNNYLNVTKGGPQYFFFKNILRFPTAKEFAPSYGTAAHEALSRCHLIFSRSGKVPPAVEFLRLFTIAIDDERLSSTDRQKAISKASDQLLAFYEKYAVHMSLSQVDVGLKTNLHHLRLSGKLDKITVVSKNHLVVSDFKTSRPQSRWQGDSSYASIQLHQYRQQLMFYKLLIEHSSSSPKTQVDSGRIEYLQLDHDDHLAKLEMEFSEDEMAEFQLLLRGVWQRIENLRFEVLIGRGLYDIKAFEKEIINDLKKG